MLNEERRRIILETVEQEGRVLVKDLASRLQTSSVTIRKDLEILHRRGLVQRSHGGAIRATNEPVLDPNLSGKEKQHWKEKRRIGEAAAGMVKAGESIILDSGTTTTAVARALRSRGQLTVITNAVNIASELAGTSIHVILTGGSLRENSFSLVGPLAEQTLHRLCADILFLAVDGFEVQVGPTTPNLAEAHVNRVMVDTARRVIVVCDSSKFGRRSLCQIAPPSKINQVITDSRISKADLAALTEAGVKVTVV